MASTTAPVPTTAALSDRSRLLLTGNQPKSDTRHLIQARPAGERRLVHQSSLQYPPMSNTAPMRSHTNDQPVMSTVPASGATSVAAYTANILQRSKTHHNIHLGGSYQHGGNLYQQQPPPSPHTVQVQRSIMPMPMHPIQPLHSDLIAMRRPDNDSHIDMKSNLNYHSTILKGSDGTKATPHYESLAAVRTNAAMSGGVGGVSGGYSNYDILASTQPQKVKLSHRQSAQLPGATTTTPGMVTSNTNQYTTPLTTSKSATALNSKRQSWFANYEAQHQQHQQHLRNMYGTLMRTQSIDEVASDLRDINRAYMWHCLFYGFNCAFAAKQNFEQSKISCAFFSLCLLPHAYSGYTPFSTFAAIDYNTVMPLLCS